MRTTVAVDDHLLAAAKQRGDGPLPGVDLRSNRALQEVLDRGASEIVELH